MLNIVCSYSFASTPVPDFLNGRCLRDYQLASLQWMVANWSEGRNCILGDEVRRGGKWC